MAGKSGGKGGNAQTKQDQRVFGYCPSCGEEKAITNSLRMMPVPGRRGTKTVWVWSCTTCQSPVDRKRHR